MFSLGYFEENLVIFFSPFGGEFLVIKIPEK